MNVEIRPAHGRFLTSTRIDRRSGKPYFAITAGPVAAAVWHVDKYAAAPGASPWRMRLPKLAVVGGPVLPAGLGSFVAPWVGAALITVEWLRRRAEPGGG
jgi:hypothetical protein